MNNEKSQGDQRNATDTADDAPVPSSVDKATTEQGQAREDEQDAGRNERIANIARRRRWRRRWNKAKPIIESFAGLATVGILMFTAVYTHYAKQQWTEMQHQSSSLATQVADQEKSFVATWRAAVYVGLPDGTVAEIVRDNKSGSMNDNMIVHLRNYGASTAENTIVELWVVVFPEGQPVIQQFKPFYNFSDAAPHTAGISIPPGFPFKSSHLIAKSDLKLVDRGKAGLHIVGRLSYTDAFGKYCQPFAIGYLPTRGFSLSGNPSSQLCSGKPHEARYYEVKVGPKPTRVWPPPENLKPKVIEDP